MDKVYAQVVDGMVNLVGGTEVGLPHDNISDTVQVIDITDTEVKPEEGWYYVDGEFLKTPPDPEPTEPVETTDQKLARLEEQNIILMDALATTFEEVLALREIVEGGTGA